MRKTNNRYAWAVGPAAGGKINRTMYLTPEELKSHMYAHIVEEITEGDEQIVLQAIEAAVEEVRSYLRPRYDTDRISRRRVPSAMRSFWKTPRSSPCGTLSNCRTSKHI